MFDQVDSTSKRLEIFSYVATFYRRVIDLTPENLLPVIYLSINRICPDFDGLELGIGECLLKKAIAESTGDSLKVIQSQYEKIGDLGTVAQNRRLMQPTMFATTNLTVLGVFNDLKKITGINGHSSQTQKICIFKNNYLTAKEWKQNISSEA